MVGLEIGPSRGGVFIGGAVNSVINLSRALSEKNHHITIVTTPPRLCDFNVKIPWAKVHQIPVRGMYRSIEYGLEFTIKGLLKIGKLHRKEAFQIIHGHSGYPAMGFISETAARLTNRPSVHTLYCPVNPKDYLAKLYLSRIDVIVTITENIKKSLERIKIPSQKIKVIPPAINTRVFNPSISGKEIREKLKIGEDEKTILFVGNLTKKKGIDILLEAMKSVIKCFPEVKLLMTTEMPHKDYEKREQEINFKIEHFGLKKHIIRFGIIKNMAELMAASNVLVAPFLDTYGPSDYPLPVLEAMGVGKPVIATRVGGIPEVISNMENGILVKSNDVNMLSEAIITLLENEKLQREFGKRASSLIINNFSPEKVSREMEVIYEEIQRG
ncbi:MAG: glycosyltransferase family 4 protein [Candidatus Jordarchaeaceae archaeon]